MSKLERLQLKSAAKPVVSKKAPKSKKRPAAWALLSLLSNLLLLGSVLLLLWRGNNGSAVSGITGKPNSTTQQPPASKPELGTRHQWNYDQWLTQLKREAAAAAENKPDKLTVLLGDSLSLWFPPQMLPTGRFWLNQGISGETTDGLLRRLSVLDATKPQTVFVMVGINDLLKGTGDEVILDNFRQIVQDIKSVHPDSYIVLQSILPHAVESTWEGREKLLEIPNSRILELNRKIAVLAKETGVKYLDLQPLFTDEQGNLRADLTTDGLHFNAKGYLVWSTALQLFSQIELQPRPQTPAAN